MTYKLRSICRIKWDIDKGCGREWRMVRRGVSILCRIIRDGLTGKVVIQQRTTRIQRKGQVESLGWGGG